MCCYLTSCKIPIILLFLKVYVISIQAMVNLIKFGFYNILLHNGDSWLVYLLTFS